MCRYSIEIYMSEKCARKLAENLYHKSEYLRTLALKSRPEGTGINYLLGHI